MLQDIPNFLLHLFRQKLTIDIILDKFSIKRAELLTDVENVFHKEVNDQRKKDSFHLINNGHALCLNMGKQKIKVIDMAGNTSQLFHTKIEQFLHKENLVASCFFLIRVV